MAGLRRSGKVALCGVLCALAVICMLLTVIPAATFSMPALAGLVLLPLALEIDLKWGLAGYVATAVLSFLIAPDMEAKVLFIGFFGYYPVLKTWLDKQRPIVLQWVVKLLLFNVTMVGAYCLLLYVLGLPADTFELFDINIPFLLLGIGNVIFVIFDLALTSVTALYWRRGHKLFARLFK